MNFIYIKKVLEFCQQAHFGLRLFLFIFPCLCSANSPMPFFFMKRISPVHLVCIQHQNQSQRHFLLRKVGSSLSLFGSSTVCPRFSIPKLSMPQDISKCHQLLYPGELFFSKRVKINSDISLSEI